MLLFTGSVHHGLCDPLLQVLSNENNVLVSHFSTNHPSRPATPHCHSVTSPSHRDALINPGKLKTPRGPHDQGTPRASLKCQCPQSKTRHTKNQSPGSPSPKVRKSFIFSKWISRLKKNKSGKTHFYMNSTAL